MTSLNNTCHSER